MLKSTESVSSLANTILPVIEDAAQAIGAAYHSRPAGSWGLVGCFSFYPTKNLGGMGDGGMMTSCDAATADRLRLFAGHGMRPRYYHQVVGINSRLDTFQAAVLQGQAEAFARCRRSLVQTSPSDTAECWRKKI